MLFDKTERYDRLDVFYIAIKLDCVASKSYDYTTQRLNLPRCSDGGPHGGCRTHVIDAAHGGTANVYEFTIFAYKTGGGDRRNTLAVP